MPALPSVSIENSSPLTIFPPATPFPPLSASLMASGPEGTEPLNYQTSVLKVSIHCEGCKKKVKKVLQRMDGVYAIDVNSKQNKVTVTGSVDAESLIRRLVKYGKHAELWPEQKPIAANSSSEVAGEAKANTASAAAADAAAADAAAVAPKTEQQLPNTEKKKQQQTEEGKNKPTPAPPTATAPAASASAISGEVSASKTNIDAPNCKDSNKMANSDKKDSEKPASAVEANVSEEADGFKKKGETAPRETISIEERAVTDSDAVGNSAAVADVVIPPPPKQFPVYAQPVYTVSYSAVQPSTSYAYYTSSPAAMPSSYTYSGYPPPLAYPPENYLLDSYYGSMEAPAASGGSYDMFNDENPNACNLM